MKLPKKSGFIVIAAVGLMCACSPKVYYKAAWQTPPVTADGKLNEWPHPLKYYDPVSKCSFSISNDNSNLNICLEFTDREVIKGLVERGLQIWLDTTGKKKKVIGILCPLPHVNTGRNIPKRRTSGGWAPGGYYPDTHAHADTVTDTSKNPSIRTIFLESAKKIHVTGFRTVANGILDLRNDNSGIDIGITWDEPNELVYEITLPFSTFYRNHITPADTLKKIGITFNFTSIPKDYKPGQQRQGGIGFMPMFGFGFGGFGYGPMDMMMDDYDWGGGNIPPQPKDETIWLPVHLTLRQ
jgi:hypothetical protein